MQTLIEKQKDDEKTKEVEIEKAYASTVYVTFSTVADVDAVKKLIKEGGLRRDR